MNEIYARDLDLNLLRVFVVVADSGSVTAAAAKLYLTQSAVSAALRRLTTAVATPLFVRQGRGITLSARGRRLLVEARPHLSALVQAALTPGRFEAKSSTRTFRLGLSDASEAWLLPPLLKTLERQAPNMKIIVSSVQFRTVAEALDSRRLDAAVTVADELPAGVKRTNLFRGGFVCLFDPRHAGIGTKLRLESYFSHEHVVVSYNDDLRGIVEDALEGSRKVRCSVPSFASVGAIVDGSPLLATIPEIVAQQIRAVRPHLRTAKLPFELGSAYMELLWPSATDDDPACAFLREHIVRIARKARRKPAAKGEREAEQE